MSINPHDYPGARMLRVKAGKGNAARHRGAMYCIEGQYVTRTQIAQRIGVHPTVAGERLNRLKNRPGEITWEKLGLVAENPSIPLTLNQQV